MVVPPRREQAQASSRRPRAFTILELILCVAVIAVLMAVLLPLLSTAKRGSYAAVCGNNLHQLSVAWLLYVQDNRDRLPQAEFQPEWRYGGVDFLGTDRTPVLASSRPLNRYVDSHAGADTDSATHRLFECPGDSGIALRAAERGGRSGSSILPFVTCFETFGTSYRANGLVLDSTKAGIDQFGRPLALHEIHVPLSRVLLMGDPAWYYATRQPGKTASGELTNAPTDEANLAASWHGKPDQGNMLAIDGSVRFTDFTKYPNPDFDLSPRP
jgi:prepilin-type N-terminal cleavage/methylation domain-containing protein